MSGTELFIELIGALADLLGSIVDLSDGKRGCLKGLILFLAICCFVIAIWLLISSGE